MITNLLTNALKLTLAGGRVTVLSGTTGQSGSAVFRLTDTGAGIPADELPHIFERFWRGPGTSQTSAAASASRSRPSSPWPTAAN